MKTYYVPINTPEIDEDGEEGSMTVDVVQIDAKTKKQRIKQWHEYLRVRLGTNDVHTYRKVTRELGFRELLK